MVEDWVNRLLTCGNGAVQEPPGRLLLFFMFTVVLVLIGVPFQERIVANAPTGFHDRGARGSQR